MKIALDWTNFKNQVTTGGLPYRYLSIDNTYFIYAVDGSFEYETSIAQTTPASADQTDFETNFKNVAFSTFSQLDTDGAEIVRIKAAKKGWSFWAVPVEITTSTIGGTMFAQTSDGTNISWVNCKIYDGNNAEITTPGLANINLASCVKTVLDFEPTFDFEIIGGALRINSNPATDIRLWIVGAPDIPAQFGGSKEFASGINLKFLAPDSSFEIDGRVTKFLSYNPATHQGKMRVILKHPAGTQINLQLVIHLYRL